MTYLLHRVELWRPIPSQPGYEASNLGRIRSVDRYVTSKIGVRRVFRGCVRALSSNPAGYLAFRTTRENVLVSRAVLEAFDRPGLAGEQACHRDGNEANNCVENLRWDTQTGNEADKIEHGTLLAGEKHPMARLSIDEVKAIRSDTRRHREIAASFGISRTHVGGIKAGIFWKHA